MMCERIGSWTMTLEISPEEKRPTYAGITSFGALASMILSGGIGGAIMAATGDSLKIAAIPGIIFSALSVWFLLKLKEPRKQSQ
jgi:MFS family permease